MTTVYCWPLHIHKIRAMKEGGLYGIGDHVRITEKLNWFANGTLTVAQKTISN